MNMIAAPPTYPTLRSRVFHRRKLPLAQRCVPASETAVRRGLCHQHLRLKWLSNLRAEPKRLSLNEMAVRERADAEAAPKVVAVTGLNVRPNQMMALRVDIAPADRSE